MAIQKPQAYNNVPNEVGIMSNLWFNIRFGIRHWQWGPDGMAWGVNSYHLEHPPVNWFQAYCLFGKQIGL